MVKTETKEHLTTKDIAPLLTEAVKGLKFYAGQEVFSFDRRRYKVISIVKVDNELEINFEAVAKGVAKRYASVSFRDGEPVYDGFNEIVFNKSLPKEKKVKKTPEEILKHKQEYQKQYYLNKTKLKRARYRAENPLPKKEYNRTCIICGNNFVSASPIAKYCSPECDKVGTREVNRKFLERYKKTEAYKKAIEKTRQNRAEKLKNDKEYAERFKEQQRKYREKCDKNKKNT